MFVDASAIVAMIAGEPEAEHLAISLEASERRTTSAIAVLETVMAIRRLNGCSVSEAEALVTGFRSEADVTVIPVGAREGRAAVEAYARFGKGQGHPARLNLADCFAYACARTNDVPLLFVGSDFSQTDIPPAA